MVIGVGIILSLVFIGWLVWWAVKRRPVKAHMVMYGLSWLTGIFTLAFFLDMDMEKIVKILVCIVLGAALIFLAGHLQRRQSHRSE